MILFSSRQSCRLQQAAASTSRKTRSLVLTRSSKGFGTSKEVETVSEQAVQPIASKEQTSTLDALEDRIRNKRPAKGNIVPQVKVESAVVNAVTGKTAPTAATQIESAGVLFLFYFFLLILIEGLALAGSGFLPEEADQWIQQNIYPNYSGTTFLFLGCSSFYGLFKTGKLPGQKQL